MLQLRTALALSLAYISLEWISSIHEYKGLPFTAWDPGLGLLFALMILRPAIAVPALFLGVAGAEAILLNSVLSRPQIASVAFIITSVYALMAHVIKRIGWFDPELPQLRDLMALLAAGLAGAILSAVLLISFLIAVGQLTPADIILAGWPHIVGDTIGICIVAPLCLMLASKKFQRLPPIPIHFLWETLCLIATIAVFAWLAARPQSRENLQYLYLLFIPVVLAAVRHGLPGASVMLALTQTGLVIVLDWVDTDATKFAEYQTLMLILTGTGLLVGAIVSERDTARQRIRSLAWEAARAARFNLVSGMAAALSHEISQPLTAARARARTIERLVEMNDMPRLRENLGPLVEQIDRAAKILQNMREFLRRGSPDAKITTWDAIAAGARVLFAPLAAEKNVSLSIKDDAALPPVMCDQIQIEQVLINLAGNAIDAISSASVPGGAIEISANVTGDQRELEVSVRDNGPGIDPTISERLFDATATTRHDGMGLGIAICVSIIEAHHGRLWLESSQKGNTEFRFRIKLPANGDKK